MVKNEKQEERMKTYFIEATKEILKGEGLKVVSVRNIAERAGYSYATLYNYFKDVKELVFICVKDFQEECRQIVEEETKNSVRGTQRLKAILKSYVKYFVQYPGIFELFFLERMNDIGHKKGINEIIYDFPDKLCQEEWEYCIANHTFSENEAAYLKNNLKYAVTSLLLFYLNRGLPKKYDEFLQIVEKNIDFILLKKIH